MSRVTESERLVPSHHQAEINSPNLGQIEGVKESLPYCLQVSKKIGFSIRPSHSTPGPSFPRFFLPPVVVAANWVGILTLLLLAV